MHTTSAWCNVVRNFAPGENFGKFGYDWRQKDAAGKVLRTIPDLYDYAEKVVKPEFDELMTYIGTVFMYYIYLQ